MPSLRDFKPRTYTVNSSAFNQFVAQNRLHQNDALNAITPATIGQVISPCGTGKTRIQICLHVGGMLSKPTPGTFVIASHRLSLNHQLLGELVGVIIPCGIKFNILCIGSDRDNVADLYVKYSHFGFAPTTSRHLTTLSEKEVQDFILSSHAEGRHVLVVSTYNSINRLANVGKIDLITHDEAQNIPRSDFSDNIRKVKPNVLREYYFTATRKVQDNGGGMDDLAFFGPILYVFKPQEALERGEIATPRIHLINGLHNETTDTTNQTMTVRSLIEGFLRHKEQVKLSSCLPEEVGAKMIGGCTGIEGMLYAYFHPEMQSFFKAQDLPNFAISSEGAYFNGQKITYQEFFILLHALDDGDDAIILNVDMLTEGIDLPSITGVMPMRSLGVIKLIQLFGRALRLHKQDRTKLYDKFLLPEDYPNFVKPYGYLILPEHLLDDNDDKEMKRIICDVYAECGVPVEKMVIIDRFNGGELDDLDPMIEPDMGDGKEYDLKHDMVDIKAAVLKDLLEEKIDNLPPQQAIDYILTLCEET
jgi:superfamily II DNA or RNA helicase